MSGPISRTQPAAAGHVTSRPAARPQVLAAGPAQVVLITLLATGARLWLLGDKTLSYDETISAIGSQAAPAELIRFAWTTTFSHTPAWMLLMNAWTHVFGRSELAVRLPAALAGILAVPLLWQLLRTWWPERGGLRLTAGVLIALAPLLVFYSQDARMYGLALLLGLASLYAATRWLLAPGPRWLAAFVAINWAMLAFQYYFLLLLGIEGLFLLAVTWPRRRLWWQVLAALALSAVPIALWFSLSPGFRGTVKVLLSHGSGANAIKAGAASGPLDFLDTTWRDLTFGSIRWRPAQSVLGYVLLPFALWGGIEAWRSPRTPDEPDAGRTGKAGETLPVPWGRFMILAALLPLLAGLILTDYMQTRYFLFVAPLLYVFVSLAIARLWRLARPLAAVVLLLAFALAGWGLGYYYSSYHKSEYRDMAQYLAARARPEDAVILEAPRQHLPAKYYLPPSLTLLTMPAVTLPAYLPITAPRVVPEVADHQLQAIVAAHANTWLVLAGEDEVDGGEFVQHYLTAIAYPAECRDWMNVRLCHFIAPDAVAGQALRVTADYAGQLRLRGAAAAASADATGERRLLVRLDWQAIAKPAKDYKVTLRLVDDQGALIAQNDGFPIGPLLPPSTWAAGDQKPGYTALPLPAGLTAGAYRLVVGLYDPAAPQLIAPDGAEPFARLATIQVGAGGDVKVMP